LERDAEAVLLMAAELVARARAGLGTTEANTAMLRASAALAKPFAEEGRRHEERRLLEVVDAVADVYRALPTGAPPKAVEDALRAALQALGFNPAVSSLATLAAEHQNMKARGGPIETAKFAVGQVGAALLVERRRRLGLGRLPIQNSRSADAVGNWKRQLPLAPHAPPLASNTAKHSALEVLLTPHAAGTFDDALAELHAPSDSEAERRWAAMQTWSGQDADE
jgi:hypothetical protein